LKFSFCPLVNTLETLGNVSLLKKVCSFCVPDKNEVGRQPF
jgi:hypothetical protein